MISFLGITVSADTPRSIVVRSVRFRMLSVRIVKFKSATFTIIQLGS